MQYPDYTPRSASAIASEILSAPIVPMFRKHGSSDVVGDVTTFREYLEATERELAETPAVFNPAKRLQLRQAANLMHALEAIVSTQPLTTAMSISLNKALIIIDQLAQGELNSSLNDHELLESQQPIQHSRLSGMHLGFGPSEADLNLMRTQRSLKTHSQAASNLEELAPAFQELAESLHISLIQSSRNR